MGSDVDRRPRIGIWLKAGKRTTDVVVALTVLILASPIAAVVATCVAVIEGRPVMYEQIRLGRAGRRFTLYKFRTMKASRTHDPTEPVTALHPDITRLGFFLRRWKLDELPQWWNVLSGDMSIVGPRPLLPEAVALYRESVKVRSQVRPGLTGLAQVNGNRALPWEERWLYDCYYAAHASLVIDLEILAKTVGVIIMGEERYARPFRDTEYWDGVKP